jgi:hypothetical protein
VQNIIIKLKKNITYNFESIFSKFGNHHGLQSKENNNIQINEENGSDNDTSDDIYDGNSINNYIR